MMNYCVEVKEEVKQGITKAILAGQTDYAKELLVSAAEYGKMVSISILSNLEIRDFEQAIIEKELTQEK